jgi:transposase
MLASGLMLEQIRTITGLSRRGVEKIRARWNRFKFKSLFDRPRSGRRARALPAIRRLLVRTVKKLPITMGYDFTVWNTARLATYIEEQTGACVSPRRVAEILREEGFTFGLPAHTLKGKRPEREHRRKQKRLRRLKKGLSRPIRAIGSASGTRAASTSTRI